MFISAEIEDRLLLSIETNRLTVLCGAGLSMVEPSKVPAAAQLAEICWEKYNKITPNPLPTALKKDLEALALHFLNNNAFCQYFLQLVPWSYFRKDFNPGHAALADFLAIGALQFAVSTNYDSLIEDAMDYLGEPDYGGFIDPHQALPYGGTESYNPLHKIHGCCVKEREYTVWCKQQLIANRTIRERIEQYKTWLPENLPNKDLLVIGFWTDWKYLNDILFSTLTQVTPASVILVDKGDADYLSQKAPDLWNWANRSNIWFRHVQVSAAEFLDEFRCIYSRSIFRRLFEDSKADYYRDVGSEYNGSLTLDSSLSSSDLYFIRRNLEGVPSDNIVRNRKHRSEQKRFGVSHMRLMAQGARMSGSIYLHKAKNIRLIYAANECLSAVKAKFAKETPNIPPADITICAGARKDHTPHNIVRENEVTVVRPGLSGEWVIDDFYFEQTRGIQQ